MPATTDIALLLRDSIARYLHCRKDVEAGAAQFALLSFVPGSALRTDRVHTVYYVLVVMITSFCSFFLFDKRTSYLARSDTRLEISVHISALQSIIVYYAEFSLSREGSRRLSRGAFSCATFWNFTIPPRSVLTLRDDAPRFPDVGITSVR